MLTYLLVVNCGLEREPTIKIEGLNRKSNLFIEKKINQLKKLANESIIVQATEASNEKNFDLTNEEINFWANNWIENNSENNPLIKELLSNNCSNYLKNYQKTHPEILQIFVMDSQSLIVSASNITSGYLHAEEDQFTEIFRKYTFWHGGVEFHESSKTFGIQISASIKDIGAICATINLKYITKQ